MSKIQDEQTIRCFFAIPLTDEMKAHMKDYLDSVKDYFSFCKVGWTRVDNLHITLWFLGHLTPEVLQKVTDGAAAAVQPLPPFQFSFGETGAFPNFRKPKVLWLGAREGRQEIIILRHVLDNVIKELPIQRDRKNFAPHVTLGRVRALSPNYKGDGVDSSILPKWSDNGACVQNVSEICLFQSELNPAGPIYTLLKTFPLSGEPGSVPEHLKVIVESGKSSKQRKRPANGRRRAKPPHAARRRA